MSWTRFGHTRQEINGKETISQQFKVKEFLEATKKNFKQKLEEDSNTNQVLFYKGPKSVRKPKELSFK